MRRDLAPPAGRKSHYEDTGREIQSERCTHDYYRHGTTSLFASLDIATGKVIGRCQRGHRHKEFLRFLDQIERAVPPVPHGSIRSSAGLPRSRTAVSAAAFFKRSRNSKRLSSIIPRPATTIRSHLSGLPPLP